MDTWDRSPPRALMGAEWPCEQLTPLRHRADGLETAWHSSVCRQASHDSAVRGRLGFRGERACGVRSRLGIRLGSFAGVMLGVSLGVSCTLGAWPSSWARWPYRGAKPADSRKLPGPSQTHAPSGMWHPRPTTSRRAAGWQKTIGDPRLPTRRLETRLSSAAGFKGVSSGTGTAAGVLASEGAASVEMDGGGGGMA